MLAIRRIYGAEGKQLSCPDMTHLVEYKAEYE